MSFQRKPSRRLFLRGLGGMAVGLPLLEWNSEARAQTPPKVAQRFIVFFEHGGTISTNNGNGKYSGNGSENGYDAWAPATPGESLDLGPIHQVLSNRYPKTHDLIHQPAYEHTGSLLLLRGIDNMAGRKQGSYGGNHYTANCTAMTCEHVTPYSADDATMGSYETGSMMALGPSFDWVLAQRLAERNPVRFPSVNLRVSAHDYGTPFYRAARQRLSSESDPSQAFTSLFAGVTPSGSGQPDPAVVRARALKQSVLDGTLESLKVFKDRMSAQDKLTVEAHLEHVRALELRLQQLSVPVVAGCQLPTSAKTVRESSEFPAYANAQVDILIAAFRCGLTNVATLDISDMLTPFLNPPYRTDLGHSLDHAARDVGKSGALASRYNDWLKTMLDNRRWRMGLLARFLDGLRATPEGSGSMLDNSVVLWTSEFSFGANHFSTDLPVLLAGSGGGYFRTGRHIDFNTYAASNPATLQYKTDKSTHNLFASLFNAFGYPDTLFGAADLASRTGPLPGLT